MSCPSTFLGNPCQHPPRHDGTHTHRHSSGHVTTWNDGAADHDQPLGERPDITATPPTAVCHRCAELHAENQWLWGELDRTRATGDGK